MLLAFPYWVHSGTSLLEDFSSRHSHTISLLEACATTAAVIVAMSASFAAKRASIPRAKCKIWQSIIIGGDNDPEEAPSYISLTVINLGTVPIKIHSTCLSWSLPFSKGAWLVRILDEFGDDHAPRRQYPLIIMPRMSESIFVQNQAGFEQAAGRMLDAGKYGRYLTARHMRAFVYADDGTRHRVGFDRRLFTNLDAAPSPQRN